MTFNVIHIWRSIILSFISFEKCNLILKKKHLAINFDSLTSVRDKKIEKRLAKLTKYIKNTEEEWNARGLTTHAKSRQSLRWVYIWLVKLSVRWSASKRAFQLRMNSPTSDAYGCNAQTSPSFRPLFLE